MQGTQCQGTKTSASEVEEKGKESKDNTTYSKAWASNVLTSLEENTA
jgi:hypothetical protein